MFPMASMTTETASSSSSSSLPQREYQYDVFLSFRGEDTRNNFTSHLYAALDKKEIKTFRDNDELERGRPIRPDLLIAIEESRFSIIILSRNYASSTWCLDELAKIVECMKQTRLTVFPVFYDVDPSDVRQAGRGSLLVHQKKKQKTGTGSFAQAFAEHSKENRERVQRWRDALIEVADASGWHVKDRSETKVIEEIVGEILGKLNSMVPIVYDGLFGIESRVEEMMNSYLRIWVDDVRFVGICGMGGIGKTTLSRAVYERIAGQFEANCFLANVREEAGKHGLVALQKQLLSKTILTKSNIDIWDDYEGANVIRNRLCSKRVLIVLDDVDDIEQLSKLVEQRCWFGQGSRILITTRDKLVLIQHDVADDEIYEVKELIYDEALQLFCWKAFKKDRPPKDFVELSKKVLSYTKGLPLAIEVLGSSLYRREVDIWESMLSKLKEIPEKKIHNKLQISFDGLSDVEKKIFLDIACFFKGECKNRVEDILESCGFFAKMGIDNLINKSLITISSNILWMHDLLQEMGWAIVKRESEKPGECSRLWFWKDIHHVLKNNTGTERIEGIALTYGPCELYLNAEAFLKMPNLRYLKISRGLVKCCEGPSCLPDTLRAIYWNGCPLKSLPMSFSPDYLVELIMPWSHFEEIWKGKKSFPKLKILHISCSKYLIETPDFTEAPNLETLSLVACEKLEKVHPSVNVLKQLTSLDLQGCMSLTSFPPRIDLDSLEFLNLSYCVTLEKVPNFGRNMKRLKVLKLMGSTAIKELPSSIGNLSGLTILDVSGTSIQVPSFIQYASVKVIR